MNNVEYKAEDVWELWQLAAAAGSVRELNDFVGYLCAEVGLSRGELFSKYPKIAEDYFELKSGFSNGVGNDATGEELASRNGRQVDITENSEKQLEDPVEHDERAVQGEEVRGERILAAGRIEEVLNGREHLDFDNPIKVAWREKVVSYLNREISRGRRKHMKVLCMPAAECHELKYYIEVLRFRPENITAAILPDDEEALARFNENISKYPGVKPLVGNLAETLPDIDDYFDVAVLDFFGQFSQNTLDVLTSLKMEDKSHLIVNLLGKRELSMAKDLFYKSQAFINKARQFEGLPNIDEMTSLIGMKDTAEGEDTLMRSRDESLFFILVGALGKDVEQALCCNEKMAWVEESLSDLVKPGFPFKRVFQAASMMLVGRLEKYFQSIFGVEGAKRMAGWLLNVQGLLFKGLISPYFAHSVEKYKYLSKVGKTSSPFYTDFIKIGAPRRKLESYEPFYDFFLEIMVHDFFSKTMPRGDFALEGPVGKGGEVVMKKMTLTYKNFLGQMVASASLGELIEITRNFAKINKPNILDECFGNPDALPARELITV